MVFGSGAQLEPPSLRSKFAEMEVERFQKQNANDKGKLGGGFKYFLFFIPILGNDPI